MKLSIIIPTFNSSKVLGRAMDSIECQTFADWEVLIMDGVSADDTIKIAQSYNDNRVRVYSEPDKGIYDAMNKGIDKANGEWLYFMGSDDYLYNSQSLEKIFINSVDGYDVVYGTVYAPHWEDRYKGEWKIENYMDNRCHQAIFYKRSFFGKKVRYDTRFKVCADSAINLRWFLSPKFSSHYYPVVVANYSDGGYSSHTIDNEFNKAQAGLILKYGHSVLPIDEKKKMAWWYMSANPEKKINNLVLRIYVVYLRLIAKL
ncbi:MAG: glycosyltransferase [Bacteroidales bacterium]|nr:glycosyltransferase [Bacteroidales bacterium]